MKKYIPLFGSIILLGCQSTQEDSVSSLSSVIANNPSSAIEMTPEKFMALTDGIPKAGKFDSFEDLYRDYIADQGIYYSDVTLSDWKGYKNTYEMPILIINSKEPRFKSYDAQTAMGVDFTVVRVDMYDDRITINNGTLGELDVEKAKELDGSAVRIYYKLSNKDDVLNRDKTTIQTVCHNIRWSTPKVTEPFDFWDHGCELNADIIAIKSLKLNEYLPFASSKKSVMNKYNNYEMQHQGLKYISEY